MTNKMHFNVSLDTYRVVDKNDPDSEAVMLVFTDKEEGVSHIFPIPIGIAGDLGGELIRLSKL